MRLTLLSAIFAAVGLLAPHAFAQTCSSSLVATWDPPSSTLTIDLTGAPLNAPTMTFIGLNQGTTTMHGVTLGLAMPFYGLLWGVTDGAGDLTVSRTLANSPTGFTAYLQSVSMDMGNHTQGGGMGGGGMGGGGMGGGGMGGGHGGPMAMTFCVSNVDSVTFP